MKLRLSLIVFAFLIPLTACNKSEPTKSSSASAPASTNPTTAAQTSPSSNAPSNWYTYSSASGKYTAKFPEKPKENQQSVPIEAKTVQKQIQAGQAAFLDSNNKRIYLVSHTDIPIPVGANTKDFNTERFLDQGREQTLKSMQSTLKSETKINQNGTVGREIKMTLPKGGSAVTRLFINTKDFKAYRALVAVQQGEANFPEAKMFLDSFTIN